MPSLDKSTTGLVPGFSLVCGILLLGSGLGACGGDSGSDPGNGGPDAKRGKSVYLANCIACHNVNPAKDGPIGPAIRGSSLELLEARILRQEYPPGYTPKRDTALMPVQSHLEADLVHLAAFLR